MGIVFVDTSALLALFNREDLNHGRAVQAFGELREERATLLTTSYVLVETVSLVQRRFSLQSSLDLGERVQRSYTMLWVDELLHAQGWATYRDQSRRLLSLVDCVSFAAMRARSLQRAFAFDDHFRQAGFVLCS